MNTEEVNTQEDLSITPMSEVGHSDKANKIISELNSIYGKSKDKIGELIEVLRQEDKLNDKQIKKVLLSEVRFISRTTLYEALPDDMKRKYEHKPLEDRVVQKVEPEPIDVPVPTQVKRNSWDGMQDSEMTIEQLRERNRQSLVSQGKIQDSVYREPDRVEPRPEWNKDKMDTVQEQSFRTTTNIAEDKTNDYHIMNVPVTDSRPLSDSRVPVPEPIDPNYTVTTQLQIHNGTGNNIGQFTTDITVHCYPMSKTVKVEPIDKATIRKVKQ